MGYKLYTIYYVNPNIPGDTLKSSGRAVVARNQDEADNKATRKLRTTGMFVKAFIQEKQK